MYMQDQFADIFFRLLIVSLFRNSQPTATPSQCLVKKIAQVSKEKILIFNFTLHLNESFDICNK